MATSVNIWMTNWTDLGTEVLCPQFSMDLHVEWVAEDGSPHSADRTPVFPNILASLPPALVKEKLEEWLLEAVRLQLGVDD